MGISEQGVRYSDSDNQCPVCVVFYLSHRKRFPAGVTAPADRRIKKQWRGASLAGQNP